MKKNFLAGILLITLGGCFNDLQDINKIKSPEINPLLEFPLVDSKVVFEDFDPQIPQFIIGTRSDGTTTLYFEKVLDTIRASDYYVIPPQPSHNTSISGYPVPSGSSASGTHQDVINVLPPNSRNIELSQINLKSGSIEISSTSSFPSDATISITLRIPGMEKDGVSFQQTFSIPAGINTFPAIDLSNYIITLTDGVNYNQLPFEIDFSVTAGTTPTTSLNQLDITLDFLQPDYSLLTGISGSTNYETVAGTQNVNVLGNTTVTEFSIEEPKVELEVQNSFGIPFDIGLNSLSAKDQQGITTTLSGTVMTDSNPFTISAPDIFNVGQSVTSTLSIDHTNSNLKDIVSKIPVEFNYDTYAFFPGSGSEVFVSDQSEAIFTVKAEIPLYGRVNNLYFEKQMAFNGNFFKNILDGELLITTRNRYPMNIGMVFGFYDANGNLLLTLFETDPFLAQSPTVDGDGRTSEEMVINTFVSLDDVTLNALTQATELRLYITFHTTDNGTSIVRFTNQDYLELHIGAKGRAKL